MIADARLTLPNAWTIGRSNRSVFRRAWNSPEIVAHGGLLPADGNFLLARRAGLHAEGRHSGNRYLMSRAWRSGAEMVGAGSASPRDSPFLGSHYREVAQRESGSHESGHGKFRLVTTTM